MANRVQLRVEVSFLVVHHLTVQQRVLFQVQGLLHHHPNRQVLHHRPPQVHLPLVVQAELLRLVQVPHLQIVNQVAQVRHLQVPRL